MRADLSPFCSNLYFWTDKAAIFFSNKVTIPHSHNTLQIIFDLQGGFKCRVEQEKWATYTSAVISENVVHQLDTNGSMQLIIYLDASTAIAKQLNATVLSGKKISPLQLTIHSVIEPGQLYQILLTTGSRQFEQLVDQLLQQLAGNSTALKHDERIKTVKQIINESDPGELNTTSLAAKVYLSESRLRSRFKEITGISIHSYIIATRIRFAINEISGGGTVNEAALRAGFTDGSHFHKMMVKMFGISPSQFLKNSGNFTVVNCDPVVTGFKTKALIKWVI